MICWLFVKYVEFDITKHLGLKCLIKNNTIPQIFKMVFFSNCVCAECSVYNWYARQDANAYAQTSHEIILKVHSDYPCAALH